MRVESAPDVRLTASPLVDAFLTDFAAVSSLYPYDWSRQESFAARARHLSNGGYRGDRAAVSSALARYNEAVGSAPETMAAIRSLREPGTLCVVTGQQAGIFSGPAYSIYKAMTAVHLAREQSEKLGIPVVPVFWVAAEDHDWREVSWVLAPAGESIARLALKESFDGDRRSVGLAPAPPSLAELMEEFAALLPDSEFKGSVLERVRAAAAAPPALDAALTGGKPSLVDWFARLTAWLFAGTGLILLNPADPGLRKLEAPFFARVIQRHEEVGEALGRGHARMEGLGYTPTVDYQVGNTNLFTYMGEERLSLAGAGEYFWIRDQEEVGWSQADLLQRAAESPGLFSTNVVLRPVIQGFLLPDLAYVGGPGEISYFGLYKDVFAALDQEMPVVYPRESYTLVEPPLARLLEKHGLTLAEALYRLDERRREFVEREDRLGLANLFEQFRTDLGSRYGELVEVLVQLDPSLSFVAEENRRQIAAQVNKLEEKARQQHRKTLETSLRQFDRVKAHLAPDGLQERSVSILPYLAKYGPDLVSQLVEATRPGERWEHRVVYLGV